ncbi:hypothetical protein O6P43_009748 [Quillaja saponaria]|uniref:Uncharacterized protein n=1 Tax=Quillaja saponaria TaxID=32244 RepID=A0AAD7VDQ2_QUISA|nr:hypothetical protein O6P43_009748 [Quillaja saponaria]
MEVSDQLLNEELPKMVIVVSDHLLNEKILDMDLDDWDTKALTDLHELLYSDMELNPTVATYFFLFFLALFSALLFLWLVVSCVSIPDPLFLILDFLTAREGATPTTRNPTFSHGSINKGSHLFLILAAT